MPWEEPGWASDPAERKATDGTLSLGVLLSPNCVSQGREDMAISLVLSHKIHSFPGSCSLDQCCPAHRGSVKLNLCKVPLLMLRCLEHLLTVNHRIKVSRKAEIWIFPQLEYKPARGVWETDEQAVSAAVLIAHVRRGRDLEKCLKGRKYLLKLFRKGVTVSRQDMLVGPT